MGQKEHDRYMSLQVKADNIWKYYGFSTEAYEKAQAEADAAYEAYEYAAGLKSWDY